MSGGDEAACVALPLRPGLLVLGLLLLAGGAAWIAGQGLSLESALRQRQAPASTPFGLLVLPGLACVGLWYARAHRLKVLAATGTLAPAELQYVERRLWPWPRCTIAGYRFRDGTGAWREARQRVPLASALGLRLQRGGAGLWVVYAADSPRRNRLIENGAAAPPA